MPNYRRAHVPGGTYFFSVVTHRQRRLFHIASNRTLLGKVIRESQQDWPDSLTPVVGMQSVQDHPEARAGKLNESAQSLPNKRGNSARRTIEGVAFIKTS